MQLSLTFWGYIHFNPSSKCYLLSPISLFVTPNGTTWGSHLCAFVYLAPFPPHLYVTNFFTFFQVQLKGFLS